MNILHSESLTTDRGFIADPNSDSFDYGNIFSELVSICKTDENFSYDEDVMNRLEMDILKMQVRIEKNKKLIEETNKLKNGVLEKLRGINDSNAKKQEFILDSLGDTISQSAA